MTELMSATVFIGAVIAAVTQGLKITFPQISGALTILVAALVGGLTGLVDVPVGITDITVAQGILIGLATSGTITTVAAAKKA